MALQAEVGIQGLSKPDGYWRIGSFFWDRNSPALITIRVDGYVSQEAYQSGSPAITSFESYIHLDNEQVLTAFNLSRSLAYDSIKQRPEFAESVDV